MQVGNTWRTTPDITPAWDSVMSNLDGTIGLSRFAGPGAWNDLDMLEVRHAALVAAQPGKTICIGILPIQRRALWSGALPC